MVNNKRFFQSVSGLSATLLADNLLSGCGGNSNRSGNHDAADVGNGKPEPAPTIN